MRALVRERDSYFLLEPSVTNMYVTSRFWLMNPERVYVLPTDPKRFHVFMYCPASTLGFNITCLTEPMSSRAILHLKYFDRLSWGAGKFSAVQSGNTL